MANPVKSFSEKGTSYHLTDYRSGVRFEDCVDKIVSVLEQQDAPVVLAGHYSAGFLMQVAPPKALPNLCVPVTPVPCPLHMNSKFSGTTMLGTFVNTFAIVVGSLIGLTFSRFIPTKITNTLIHGVAFAVMLIGLKMAWKENNFIILICSLAFGGVIGELIRIEDRINGLGKWLEGKSSRPGGSLSKGFVTTTLLYCVGSMALVGSLESGLTGNHDTLFAKSVLDGLGSIIFAASLGIGVLFSAVSVFFYQGCITMGASFLKQFLTAPVISQMSAVGGLLIVAMGFNMLDMVKIKVANLLPAIFLPLVYFMLVQLFRWVFS